jgi:hypothetical protein
MPLTILCPHCGSNQIKYAEYVMQQTEMPVERWEAKDDMFVPDYSSGNVRFETIDDETSLAALPFWCDSCYQGMGPFDMVVGGTYETR